MLACPVLAQDSTQTATTAAASSQDTPIVYVVQRGDTLYGIAQRFGTTVEALTEANKIADRSLIAVGQKLVIPTGGAGPLPASAASSAGTSSTRLHRVRPGETLPFLAFRYGTDVWTLREVNHLNRVGLLLPGQELIIPPPTAATVNTPTFPELSVSPAPVLQGRTMLIEVQGENDLDLSGRFLEQDLMFVEEKGRYWSVVGVDALTPPGGYPLALTVTESESGDLLTMRATFTVTAGTFATYNVPVPADRQGLLDPALARAERKKINKVFKGVSQKRLWQGTFGFPLEGERRITARFGQRRSYAGGPVSSYHSGLDYGADTGTPVSAPITGTVVLAEPLQVRGKVVILDHGLGVFTGFWHLSKIGVAVGQVVGRGQRVGLVGNTGLSTGPHLHWEMQVHGVPVNALQWTRRAFP